MSAALKVEWVHPFEKLGLGVAPYRVVGYSVSTYQACHGAPVQPAGTCDRCGQGIKHVFSVQGADGVVFKVGIDCVQHTGDVELFGAAKAARAAYIRELRQAEWRERGRDVAQRAAARRAIVAEENEEAFQELYAACDKVAACAHVSQYDRDKVVGVAASHRAGLRSDGPDDVEATVIASGLRRASLPNVGHVGAIGNKLELVATFEGGPVFETEYGWKTLARFLVVEGPHAGAVIVWPTGALHNLPDASGRGARVRIVATVKSHGDYRGEAQTIVTRAKVTL